jgi:small redox-active disulfide protein 2
MIIQILGSGCPKCKTLAANTETAVKELGVIAEIVKVTEIKEIMAMGVMQTPALVVDGVVKSSGRLLSPEQIKKMLKPEG